jgi:hypothetical protein
MKNDVGTHFKTQLNAVVIASHAASHNTPSLYAHNRSTSVPLFNNKNVTTKSSLLACLLGLRVSAEEGNKSNNDMTRIRFRPIHRRENLTEHFNKMADS